MRFLPTCLRIGAATLLVILLSQCAAVHRTAGGHPAGDPPAPRGPGVDRDNEPVMGFGILRRIAGLWHGPVSTTTPAGSFDSWYVDFRPVSPGQISQYSTLDAETVNYMSLFIVKHEGRLKVALRTEGVFQGQGCVTYEVIDTVRESEGYYRFSDFQAGDDRAYTEFTFADDEFLMEVYTNRFNRVSPLEIHCRWRAKLGGRRAAAQAVSHFDFPQSYMVKDFSSTFRHRSESIYLDLENDPYRSLEQPHVGEVTVNVVVDEKLNAGSDDELFLLLTTDSLFAGLRYEEERLKYISKYVFLPAGTRSHTFTHVHPGRYYLYAYNDTDGDRRHLSGDYMSSDVHNAFELPPGGRVTVDAVIDFVIP